MQTTPEDAALKMRVVTWARQAAEQILLLLG
jgi:hypothetical protein